MKKNLLYAFAITIAGVAFTACSDNDEPEVEYEEVDILDGNTLNAEGYWNKCYDTSAKEVLCDDFVFSHSADVTVWDGIEYKSWKGFCPANCAPVSQAPGNWTDAQWAPVTPLGSSGEGEPYLVACADAMESYSTDPDYRPTLYMERKDGKPFSMPSLYVSNSAWGYDAMKNGSAFSRPFSTGDFCKLNIHFELADGSVSEVSWLLAEGTNICKYWYMIPGNYNIKRVVFTMESSDSGEWGMNNPAYFLIGRICIAEEN
ncbi:MAG: DUF4465 domain-containing protein [Muribaculaceae bacterium]|nr:DUF4465 domain-containing protein [Muribaculaceae bacterium]